MAIYTVLEPPVPDTATPDPMKTAFVKDGFSWPALLIAVPWLVYRRQWLVLLLYLAVMIGVSLLIQRTGTDAAGFAIILLHFLFALEANNLRRWTLERWGFRLVGVAEGRNLEEAELRWFADAAAGETPMRDRPLRAPSPPAPPSPPIPPAAATSAVPRAPAAPPVPARPGSGNPSAEAGDVVGLFPSPAAPRGQTP